LDRFTEGMLNRLDRDVRKKFGLSLNAVLDDPSSYMQEKGFAVKLSRISDYVEKETENMLEQAKGSSRSFHESAAKSDELTRKIGAHITSHARQNNVPVVQPADVELPMLDKNRFYLSDMDDATSKFLEKLVESSSFVVDMTKSYDNMKLGSWLFGRDRECIVSVHSPKNSLLLLRAAREEILRRLKETSDSVKGL
jgi:hypothetical protein